MPIVAAAEGEMAAAAAPAAVLNAAQMPGPLAFAGAAAMIALIAALGVRMSGGGATQTSRQSVKHLLVQEVYSEIKELNLNLFLKH